MLNAQVRGSERGNRALQIDADANDEKKPATDLG